jgi:hypothetical protein
MALVDTFVNEADGEAGAGLEPADGQKAKALAKSALRNKKAAALPFRQLWRHKYVKHNYDAAKAWKVFYWPLTHSGAGGQGFNPATRKAAAKLMAAAFNKWAKGDMKATVKRADGEKEVPVGNISREEFIRWFSNSAPGIPEDFDDVPLASLFVDEQEPPPPAQPPKPKPDPETADLDDPEAEQKRAEELGFELKDVQAYYDMQIAQALDSVRALARTKKKFKLKRIKVSPTGKVQAPDVPNPKPIPPAPPPGAEEPDEPEEPEEPETPPVGKPAGSSSMKGGRFPEGPRGPEGAPSPK